MLRENAESRAASGFGGSGWCGGGSPTLAFHCCGTMPKGFPSIKLVHCGLGKSGPVKTEVSLAEVMGAGEASRPTMSAQDAAMDSLREGLRSIRAGYALVTIVVSDDTVEVDC